MDLGGRLAPLLWLLGRSVLWCSPRKGPSRRLDPFADGNYFVRYRSLWRLWSSDSRCATFSALLMIFWTWAKGLEDEFDGSNRRNLRHFISTEVQISEKPTRAASPSARFDDDAREDEGGVSEMNIATLDDQLREEVSLYLHRDTPTGLTQRGGITIDDKKKEEKLALARLPTCAIFHKLSSGKGAPHTFYGFLRQWPSVPRVVVSMPLFHSQDISHIESLDFLVRSRNADQPCPR